MDEQLEWKNILCNRLVVSLRKGETRARKPRVQRVKEMRITVVMCDYGQLLCLGGAPPAGSLSLVYMRRLDTDRPCAALPRQNGPHHQHCYPRWKSGLSRQTMLHRDRGPCQLASKLECGCIWFTPFDKTAPHSSV